MSAEIFDQVSILFSDIPAFAALTSRFSPHEIITLLNMTHSTFDGAVSEFDAYKVETIADSYMVSLSLVMISDTLRIRSLNKETVPTDSPLSTNHVQKNIKCVHWF